MAILGDIEYRRAEAKDVFPLMRLHQFAAANVLEDPLLLDYRKLAEAVESPESVWIVAVGGETMLAALSIQLDRESRLAKISRVILDPAWKESQQLLKAALPLLIHFLKERSIEVLYTTTRTLTLAQQELTLGMGFKILGIFPNAQGADSLKLNGLTAYFFDDVLTSRRHANFAMHPMVQPIYELARKQCELPPLPVAEIPRFDASQFSRLPELEFIHAPGFVSHRFSKLKQRRSLSVAFYPFSEPNALITDPDQKLELFIKIVPEIRFAAIIGERLDLPINPTDLYNEVSLMLNRRNISFIEVINDAADPAGIEFITNACFIPCVYFPCFKLQGEERRDFVVFARSFERVLGGTGHGSRQVNRAYLDFLTEFYRIDERIHFNKLTPR